MDDRLIFRYFLPALERLAVRRGYGHLNPIATGSLSPRDRGRQIRRIMVPEVNAGFYNPQVARHSSKKYRLASRAGIRTKTDTGW